METIDELCVDMQIILYNVISSTADTRSFGHPRKQTLISTSFWRLSVDSGWWYEMFGYPNTILDEPNVRYPDNLSLHYPLRMFQPFQEVRPVGRFTIKTLKHKNN